MGAFAGHEGFMTDIQTHLKKIRSDAAECILLSSLATDGKSEVFARTGEHLNALATEIEKTLAASLVDKAGQGEGGQVSSSASEPEAVAIDTAVADQQPMARSRRILPWLLVVILGIIFAGILWTNNPKAAYWTSLSNPDPKREVSAPGPDETRQAVATLLSGEQAERKLLVEKLEALASRLDGFVTALDNVSRANAALSNKLDAVEKPSTAEAQRLTPEDKAAGRAPAPESPAAAQRAVEAPPATESPEPVGAITVPPRRAELDARRSALGPSGCSQFRSFDPASGTYTTLDGRRRPCRQ